MPAKLTINAPELDFDTLQELTRELCMDLNQETDFAAELSESAIKAGEKGGETKIGEILLKWTKFGIEKFTTLLKVYLDRYESIEFKVEGPNGKAEVKIRKADLKDSHINKVEKLLRDVLVDNDNP